MRVISLIVLFSAVLFVSCMPQPSVDAEQRDIIDTLMPLFGNLKLKTVVTQRTVDFIKRFFDLNPKYYESFKTALAPENVFLPEYAALNWKVAKPEDFASIVAIIGDATLGQLVQNPALVQELISKFENDIELLDRLQLRVKEAGVAYELDQVNLDSLGAVLEKTVKPMLIPFTPIAMQIMFFGKRDLEAVNKVEFTVAQLTQLMNSDLSFLASKKFIAMVQQYKPLAMQFLASNSIEANLVNQIMSQFNINYNYVYNQFVSGNGPQFAKLAINTVINNPTLLATLNAYAPQLMSMFPRLDINWNSLGNQLLGSLTTVLPSILIGLLGKRDAEKQLNIQQIISSPQVQSIISQAQQFLAANPQLFNFINQQLSALGIQLPKSIDLNGLVNTLINTAIQVLPSLLTGLIGKRDVEKQLILPNIQQILSSPQVQTIISQAQQFLAANPQLFNFINQQLSALGIQLPRLDINWNSLGNQLLGSLTTVLPSILIGLLGKRDAEKHLNIQQIISSPQVQTIISQAQQFLAANPQLSSFINQQLSVLGIQLPRIDIDFNGLLNTLVSALPGILIGLIGK
jgi:chemotaxis regulatin CheY-phosphate phosphatase CheZ